MLFERKWPSVILTGIAVADYVVTVSSTKGLHPKQEVSLSKIGVNPEVYEIKRVLSKTQFQLGLKGTKISRYENPIQFNGGVLSAVEQDRNVIDHTAGIRASYAEEPTVAIRTSLVDYWGEHIDSVTDPSGTVRLAVDAVLAQIMPNEISALNVPVPIPGNQYSFTAPVGCLGFTVKVRDGAASFKIAFAPGLLNTTFVKVSRGAVFNSSLTNCAGKTFYVTADKPCIIEVIVWVMT